jgi:phosphoglycerol transferase MdoB-like AlkP superfamily enzyme
MSHTRVRRNTDSDLTLGGRAIAAVASCLFSVPLMGLIWLIINHQIAPISESVLPLSALVAAIVGFAALSFAFPRLAPNVFGWICDALMRLARWLW